MSFDEVLVVDDPEYNVSVEDEPEINLNLCLPNFPIYNTAIEQVNKFECLAISEELSWHGNRYC